MRPSKSNIGVDQRVHTGGGSQILGNAGHYIRAGKFVVMLHTHDDIANRSPEAAQDRGW